MTVDYGLVYLARNLVDAVAVDPMVVDYVEQGDWHHHAEVHQRHSQDHLEHQAGQKEEHSRGLQEDHRDYV
jgi:hypothetical protein